MTEVDLSKSKSGDVLELRWIDTISNSWTGLQIGPVQFKAKALESVKLTSSTLAQYLGADTGSATKSSLTFGLADKAQAAKVTVYWPSGLKSVLENVEANQVIQIHEIDELPPERPTEEGDVIAWGANPNGETTIPTALNGVVQIAAGDSSSAALRADGTVSVWGTNWAGQRNVPADLKDVVQVAAGNNHYLALDSQGKVTAWGWNTSNQTAIPSTLRRAKFIAAGFNTSYALTGDGRIVAWGANDQGQATIPAGLSDVTALAAGRGHALALKGDGTVVAWGRNDMGQATVPAGLTGVTQIAAGDYHSVALKSNGTVVAWGANWTAQATVPAGLTNVVQISAEGDRTLAFNSDNSIVGWGFNPDNVTPPPAPGNVLGIAAGAKHSLALVRKIQIAVDGDIPTGTEGSGLDFGLTASGGTGGNYTWTIQGNKPAWLTIDPATGKISGTPTTAGTYSFIVRASSGGRWGEIEVILDVIKPELAILWVATSGSDTAGDGTLAKPFATVQKAVDTSRTGGTIMVQPGSYNGTVSIVGKSVKLLSQSGEAQTTLRGVKGKTVIEIAGEGTLVDGFTITGGTGRPQPSSYGFDYYGGGIHCRTTATVKNCIIRGNGVGTPGRDSATFGGAIYSNGKPTDILTVENCVLAENYAWASGGATLTEGSKIILDRVTVYKNDSRNFFGYQGGVSLANGGKMDLANSILWANGGDQIGAFAYPYNRGTVATVTYTLSQGGVKSGGIETFTAGTGNLGTDPKLNNPNAGDYSLQTGSPAIDTANPALKDPDNTRADMGYQAGRRSGNFDSDNDGVNDYRETYDGTNPFDPKSFNPLSVGLVAHFDGENLTDQAGLEFLKLDTKGGAKLGAGFIGNGFNLDGVDDGFILDDYTILKNDSFTVAAWVEWKGQSSLPQMVVFRGGYDSGNDPFTLYVSNNGSISTQINLGVAPTSTIQSAEGVIQIGKWMLVIATYNNVTGDHDLYVNGTLVAHAAAGGPMVKNLPSWAQPGWGIGNHSGKVFNYPFNGCIDDVKFYNRALTAAEVSQLYSEESGEPNMVLVQGGTLPSGSALANQTVSAFHIARFETTWAEWKQVRTWAVANGYTDLANVGQGSSENHPVRNISWYDAVKWCNAKSEMEGLVPVYQVKGSKYVLTKTGSGSNTIGNNTLTPISLELQEYTEVFRSGRWDNLAPGVIPIDFYPSLLASPTANGYRLPAEAEWEWAARGGIASQGFTYSGSNDPNEVAWYSGNINAQFGSKPIGKKAPNELGIYDMSGNVWEFVLNPSNVLESYKIPRGGMWNTSVAGLSLNSRIVNNYNYNEIANWGFRYARNAIGDMVTVQGGTLPAGSGLAGQKVQAFQVGRTEVTWGEWKTVRTWAAANGYSDLATVGAGTADNHPVQSVNWYEVLKWTNAKSQMEGLAPVYTVNGITYKTGVQTPDVNAAANGYRLPARIEWEWAARGGISSGNFTYSGSNDINTVAWYATNSSNATKVVGTKAANELGICDMSGNVWEWCWDYYNASDRQTYGGCFNVEANRCTVTSLNYVNRDLRWPYLGLRLARNIGPKISISGTLPEATLNQAYAGYTFGAVGSTGDKVWSISEGTLPPGMSFSANGTLSGTPTTAGTYTFVIRLESGGYWDEVEVELEVVVPLPDFASGLVAHFKFANDLKDSIGNVPDAVNFGCSFTSNRFGTSNTAISFNGQQYARIKNLGTRMSNTSGVTIAGWYFITSGKSHPYSYGSGFLENTALGPNVSPALNISLSGDPNNAIGGWAGKWADVFTSQKFPMGEWAHIALTAEVGKTPTMYMNGKALQWMAPWTPSVLQSAIAFTSDYGVGNSLHNGTPYYSTYSKGAISDLRFYNRALSASDVAKLYEYEADNSNLLVNGGFEQPNVVTQTASGNNLWITYGTNYAILQPSDSGPKALDTPFTGWQVVSGEVDVLNNRVANSTPPEGTQCLDLDGSMPGVIKQTISTTVGQTYVFSFKRQKYAYAMNYTSSLRAEVLSATNMQLVNSTVSTTPTPDVPWEWVEFKTEFTATSNSTTIKFTSLNSGGSVNGVKIDDVRVALKNYAEMVTVQGGTLPTGSGLVGQTVATFQIGKYEVTWGEWKAVRDWAVVNGYSDLAGVGATYPGGSADNLPVIYVSWYDVCKWMNAKSEKDGLAPVYRVSGAIYKTGESVPTVDSVANGYRLPTEKEWEWAARGGVSSQGYTYSGSNDVGSVAWYWDNSSNGTKAVGTKAANELAIYDMSGNVWEWCEDLVYTSSRRLRGGGWSGNAGYCTVADRVNFSDPGFRSNGIGFRLARSSGN